MYICLIYALQSFTWQSARSSRITTMSKLTCGQWDASMQSCYKCSPRAQRAQRCSGSSGETSETEHFHLQSNCSNCSSQGRDSSWGRCFDDFHMNLQMIAITCRIVVRSSLDRRAIRSLQTGSIERIHDSTRSLALSCDKEKLNHRTIQLQMNLLT